VGNKKPRFNTCAFYKRASYDATNKQLFCTKLKKAVSADVCEVCVGHQTLRGLGYDIFKALVALLSSLGIMYLIWYLFLR
jgi:hypothetical protein